MWMELCLYLSRLSHESVTSSVTVPPVPERGGLPLLKEALPTLSKSRGVPLRQNCARIRLFAIIGVHFERKSYPKITENTGNQSREWSCWSRKARLPSRGA